MRLLSAADTSLSSASLNDAVASSSALSFPASCCWLKLLLRLLLRLLLLRPTPAAAVLGPSASRSSLMRAWRPCRPSPAAEASVCVFVMGWLKQVSRDVCQHGLRLSPRRRMPNTKHLTILSSCCLCFRGLVLLQAPNPGAFGGPAVEVEHVLEKVTHSSEWLCMPTLRCLQPRPGCGTAAMACTAQKLVPAAAMHVICVWLTCGGCRSCPSTRVCQDGVDGVSGSEQPISRGSLVSTATMSVGNAASRQYDEVIAKEETTTNGV